MVLLHVSVFISLLVLTVRTLGPSHCEVTPAYLFNYLLLCFLGAILCCAQGSLLTLSLLGDHSWLCSGVICGAGSWISIPCV